MDLSAVLAADLDDLMNALDQPDTGLASVLLAFGSDAHDAVDSFLGLTMTIFDDSVPFSFTVVEPSAAETTVAASLLLPLPLLAAGNPSSHLVLYATKAGAFVDLLADWAYALDVDLSALPMDQHLSVPEHNATTGLSDTSVANQGIGVLIDRGNTAGQARAELDRLAGPNRNLAAAAHQVIASITRPPACSI